MIREMNRLTSTLAAVSFAFAGHTTTTSPKLLVDTADAVHLMAGATWFGGLVFLTLTLLRRGKDRDPVALSGLDGSVVVVPLAEELAFRSFLTRRLVAADFTEVLPGQFSWPSFLISSALFGALHGRWLAGTIAGMAYALVLYRRGELGDAISAHAITNALIAAYVLATGAYTLW